jgi:hypothetical protein
MRRRDVPRQFARAVRRGRTEVPLAQAAWAEIPQVSCFCCAVATERLALPRVRRPRLPASSQLALASGASPQGRGLQPHSCQSLCFVFALGVPIVPSEINDPGRTRTMNPRIRKPVAYPLGHGACCSRSTFRVALGRAACCAQVRRHRACHRSSRLLASPWGSVPDAGRSLAGAAGSSGPSPSRWRRRGHGATVARLTPDQKSNQPRKSKRSNAPERLKQSTHSKQSELQKTSS